MWDFSLNFPVRVNRKSPLNHEALPSVEKGGVGERSIPYKNPVLPARGLLALWEILFYRLGAVFLQFWV